ncbi:hypothetical protein [Kitasatospora cheerisanensis]|uniref:PLL-like beta propeller domain-containing protein n=1 Tax=Kitasatospora cheerisanensis KCTC 2395 TaxID=1348663 RepID=A0A066Z228_9ACTN|nr:hypothetical protein [Kitasatospora cheerisanensis]KDN87833.1 hypothetical protein KCH_04800 [Kitasatospora cheerisanensis KCTC 2395]
MIRLFRRLLGLLAVTAVAAGLLVTVSGSAQAAFASGIDGWITRAEVIERAQYWVDHQPGPYNQGGFSPGPTGDRNYRRDCSGYVDMAWHLGSDNWTGNLSQVSYSINRQDLLPGDILLDTANHVILFNAWEADHTRFTYYSFGADPVKKVGPVSINAATIDDWPNGNFEARRYNRIMDNQLTARRHVGMNANQTMEFVDNDGSGGVRTKWQDNPNSTWHDWYQLPGAAGVTGAPVLGRNANGTQEIFARTASGQVVSRWQLDRNGAWHDWYNHGGNVASELAVAANANGSQQIFARTPDGRITTRWQDNPNSTWHDGWLTFDGDVTFVGNPAVSHNADGTLEVFARTNTGHVMSRWQVAPNSTFTTSWYDHGGDVASDPVVGLNQDGRQEIFALTADGRLTTRWQDNPNSTWHAWSTFERGGFVGDPAVALCRNGNLELFVRDAAGTVWNIHQLKPNSVFSDWTEVGGTLATNPVLGENRDGRLEIFGKTASGTVTHAFQSGIASAFGTFRDL